MNEYVDIAVGSIFFVAALSRCIYVIFKGRQKLKDVERVDKDKD